MRRRNFVLGGVAAAVMPRAAQAAMRCTEFDARGIQYCEAGIPSMEIYSAEQACEQWCWAACIQMIFARHGRFVEQTDIVERVYPNLACRPANGPQIVQAVNSGVWYDSDGDRFYAEAYPLADFSFGVGNMNAAAAAATELAEGYPLINGALGHATVLTAMTYYRDVYSRGQVESLTVRDPWPYNPRRRTLTANEVNGTNLLVAVHL